MKKSTKDPHSHRARGYAGEKIVQAYLERSGYQILDTNWTISGGEIDIIAGLGEKIIFIEVKLRTTTSRGSALESLTSIKRKRFRKSGLIWAMQYNLSEESYQFDFISLQKSAQAWRLEHHKNIEVVA